MQGGKCIPKFFGNLEVTLLCLSQLSARLATIDGIQRLMGGFEVVGARIGFVQ